MAHTRRNSPPSHLDLGQIFSEAKYRWLRPAEICEILTNYKTLQIASEPANMPPGGSLFLYDRKVLRYFRKDGHNWRKKKDGKTVREAHERLKSGSVDVLHCYYAHGEENENFQRRTYWRLEEELSHIVLVHYREVTNQGNEAIYRCANSHQSDGTMLNTQMDTSISSSFHPHIYKALSQTLDTTSMNSGARASDDEEAEPDDQEKLSSIPGVNYIYLNQENKTKDIHNVGLTYEPSKILELEDILKYNAGSQRGPFQPLVNSNLSLGDQTSELHFTTRIANQDENESVIKVEGNKQGSGCKSLCISNSHIDSAYSAPTREASYSNREQLEANDEKVSNSNDELKSDQETNRSLDGIDDSYFASKKTQLDGAPAEEGLKKLDSFNQWMSKELGDVKELSIQSTHGSCWDTVEGENGVDSNTVPSQVHLDSYILDPSICHDQLFSIIDFAPSWAFEDSETKVIISGRFLRSRLEAESCKWSCMFGEVEVPAEIIGNGVLCCHTPPHKAERVPFYVTCSNRLACSEVREFDFLVNYDEEVNTPSENNCSIFDIFSMRFGELLSLGPGFPQIFDPVTVSDKSHLRSKISSLLREEDDNWDKLLKLTMDKDFSPEKVQEQLLRNILKEKLLAWLLHKITEDGKGPNVLDANGQGILHFAAALGYDWALQPTIVAGVNVNFRDVNGWSALHWAAFCGRERTVASLISLGAAPGALTDPCPECPSGRTPADLAYANGFKGIAGYLSEVMLSAHLLSLDLNREVGENSEAKLVQRIPQNTSEVNDEYQSDQLSLKDSLAALCNASQSAARIHQVFRLQSFQRKQLKEHDNDKFGMSDERALSLLAFKPHKAGQRDEPVHAAATRIQNKFRSWKSRKEFLMIRQQIVKIQAHVRGHQVRKNHLKLIWSVGILEKVILRWRRKGSGLRGFKSEAVSEGAMMQDISAKEDEDDYDVLKEGRKQTEKRLQVALARVKSMVQYPEARHQYHRLLNVVTEIQKNQGNQAMNLSSEETGEFDSLVDLETLLDEDIFMPTAT